MDDEQIARARAALPDAATFAGTTTRVRDAASGATIEFLRVAYADGTFGWATWEEWDASSRDD